MTDKLGWIDRRRLVQLLGAGGGAIAAGLPSRVFAQARKNTLVLGIDISDTITLDPARLAQYTSPMTVSAAYDSLVTMKPGEYINVEPSLATKWARTPDGKGWRFTLRDGVKFATGNVDDGRGREVVVRPRHQPRATSPRNTSRMSTASRSSTRSTIDIILKDPARAAAHRSRGAGIRRAGAQGGRSEWRHRRRGRQGPRTRRRAWLNSNSGGTGAYRVAALGAQPADPARAQRALLGRQAAVRAHRDPPHQRRRGAAARGAPRRHRCGVQPDPGADRRAQERAERASRAAREPRLRLHGADAEAGVQQGARREGSASGDRLCDRLRRHQSTRCSAARRCGRRTILPIGVSGSTEEIARQIGFKQDLAKAKELLAKAGFPDGFEFEIIYGNAAVQGVTYQDLGLKIQSDVARVGIKATLRPIDQVNLRTEYTTGKAKGGVLTFWNPPAVENQLWAAAVVQRVAKRVHWDAAGGRREARLAGGDRARSEEAARSVGRVAEARWSIRPITSCCSSRSTRSPCATRSRSSRSPRPAGCSICMA